MTLVTKYQISAINSYSEKYLGWTEVQTDRGKTVYPAPRMGAGYTVFLLERVLKTMETKIPQINLFLTVLWHKIHVIW